MAKAFGQSPILLSRQYKLFTEEYFDSLSGLDKLLIDHAILNRVIAEENKAQEEAIKKRKEKSDHPGMERYDDIEDFWNEVEDASRGEG